MESLTGGGQDPGIYSGSAAFLNPKKFKFWLLR